MKTNLSMNFKKVLAQFLILSVVLTMAPVKLALADSPIVFADANFEACVRSTLGAGYESPTPIYPANLAGVNTLSCSSLGITSVPELEYFTALAWLDLDSNSIDTLDLSNNTHLYNVQVRFNELESIILPVSSSLQYLYLQYNSLETIDLSGATGLKRLSINNNSLTAIDVSNNTALENLLINNNQLSGTALDVSDNTALQILDAQMNTLDSIDLSNNSALTSLNLRRNNLTSIDLSANTALTNLQLDYNQLSPTVDLSNNASLTYLNLGYDDLDSIVLSANTALEYLYLDNNNLSSVNVSLNVALKTLDLSSNGISNISSLVSNAGITGGGDTVYLTSNPLEVSATADINTLLGRGIYLTYSPICGDGDIGAGEWCDDSNTDNGDGCSSTCTVESGWICEGEPSVCSIPALTCGNGVMDDGESCDDGGVCTGDDMTMCTSNDECTEVGGTCTPRDYDGCSSSCQVENPEPPASVCGNSAVEDVEQCDDGNTDGGDTCSSDCTSITIPDTALDSCVRTTLSIGAGDTITSELAAGLTSLSCDNKGIESLSGLEYFTGLTSLSINQNPISDISPISGLNNLTTLSFGWVNTYCPNLDLIGGLTNLRSLTLNSRYIPSIDFISGLTNLTTLSLYSTYTTDISSLVTNASNGGIGAGTTVEIRSNHLNDQACPDIETLKTTYGVTVNYDLGECVAVCGDWFIAPGENCDDGNTTDGDGCSSTCQREAICGDWFIAAGETCDDGNSNSGDGCSSTCQTEPNIRDEITDQGLKSCINEAFQQLSLPEQYPLYQNSALNLTTLSCTSNSISSLAGLEYFTNLTNLNLYGNSLTAVDLSANTALTDVNLSYNSISSIVLSGNTNLANLNLSNNSLASVNLSANTDLTSLDLSYNSLESVDVSHNTDLSYLALNNNSLSSVNLSANTALSDLRLSENSLGSVNLSANTALIYLDASHAGLNSINLSTNTALTGLVLNDNNLGTINLSTNTALTWMNLDNNNLTAITLPVSTALLTVQANNNELTEIDVSDDTALEWLRLKNNHLTSIDVSENLALNDLELSGNSLTSLSLTANTALTWLELASNALTTVNLSGLTLLSWIDLSSNTLTTVDLSEMTVLSRLDMSSNNVSDVSFITANPRFNDGHGTLLLSNNPLTYEAYSSIQTLRGRGVQVTLNWYCGNHVVEGTEQCDDGNRSNNDACLNTCVSNNPVCGDGVLDYNEACDDGNTSNGDGCNDSCSSVTIPDAALNTCIRAALHIENDAPITRNNVFDLGQLNCYNAGVSSLTGLENFTSLVSIDLHGNSISDISPLSNLHSLWWLAIYLNSISDISPLLSGTNGFTTYDIGSNSLDSGDCANLATLATHGSHLYYEAGICNTVCGNGFVGPGEECDDSNTNNGDGCSSTCQFEGHYDITASSGDHGSITPSGVINKASGSNQTYTITPAEGYYVVDVLVDDVSVGPLESYEFTHINTTHTISATFAQDSAITVPDAAFAACIRTELGIGGEDPIMLGGALSLTSLSCSFGAGITDLTGLENFTNLTTLDLRGNSGLSNISAVAGLTKLQQLLLETDAISDISPLENLTNLTSLALGQNGTIADLSPLSGLSNLQDLDLMMDSISDSELSDLSGLDTLTNLDLRFNSITDISDLSELTNLWRISLSWNTITDITALSGLVNLQYAYLDHNSISNITPLLTNASLGGINEATTVYLSSNSLTSSGACSDISTLQTTYGVTVNYDTGICVAECGDTFVGPGETCDDGNTTDGDGCSATCQREGAYCGNNITEAGEECDDGNTSNGDGCNSTCAAITIPDTDLNTCIRSALSIANDATITAAIAANLTSLTCWDSDVHSLAGIGFFPNLDYLRLNRGHITDLSPLTRLTNLTYLDLWINYISNLAPLSGMTSLLTLNLGYNSIVDVSPLATLTNLHELRLGTNSIEDISSLSSLTNLTYLDLSDNSISSITSLSGLINLSSLLIGYNNISDISPLASNTGIGSGDYLSIAGIPTLSQESCSNIRTMQALGASFEYNSSECWVCGNGIVEGGETCDDSGTTGGDGCDATCQVESGYNCSGSPSVCEVQGPPGPVCGDGNVDAGETCDNGDVTNYDGCSSTCQTETDISSDITDANLMSCVRASASVPDNGPIYNDLAASVASLNCNGLGIVTTAGLQHFTGLTSLILVNDPSLTSLDLSANTALTNLNLQEDHLSSVDLSHNTALTNLNLDLNHLTSIDLSNNTALSVFRAFQNNLSSIDLSHNTALTYLYLADNQLTSIDLSQNTALTNLMLYSNLLTSIDLSNNTSLWELWLYGNNFGSTVDLSHNPALELLNLDNTGLTSLDLSNNLVMNLLMLSNNNLSSISSESLAKMRNLSFLDLGGNNLSSIDVSTNTALYYLNLGSNHISNIDSIAANTGIGWLDAVYLNANPLGISALPAINTLLARNVTLSFDPICGDGVINGTETCDDGNDVNGDGCSSVCHVEGEEPPPGPTSVCGNTIVEEGEGCDDGNSSNNDACLNTCVVATCGDNHVKTGFETCDDGNTSNGDGCSSTCQIEPSGDEPVCGNGIIENDESCDDGNTNNGDGCNSTCAAITIPDAALNTCIRTDLGIDNDTPITANIAANLIKFDCSSKNVSDLTGLENFTHLIELYLAEDPISDITPISRLTNLTYLVISNDPNLSNIDALSGLTKLDHLYINSDNISNIGALSGLTGLKYLEMGRNSITDISPLSRLTSMNVLSINDNTPPLTNISVLANLTDLMTLVIGGNDITDISPLTHLTYLARVDLENNPNLVDISALAGLYRLTLAILYNDSIADISSLVTNAANSHSSLREEMSATVMISHNDLDGADCPNIQTLQSTYGVTVTYDSGVCTAVCGDNIVGPEETCDDGNAVAGDGCSATCKTEENRGGGVIITPPHITPVVPPVTPPVVPPVTPPVVEPPANPEQTLTDGTNTIIDAILGGGNTSTEDDTSTGDNTTNESNTSNEQNETPSAESQLQQEITELVAAADAGDNAGQTAEEIDLTGWEISTEVTTTTTPTVVGTPATEPTATETPATPTDTTTVHTEVLESVDTAKVYTDATVVREALTLLTDPKTGCQNDGQNGAECLKTIFGLPQTATDDQLGDAATFSIKPGEQITVPRIVNMNGIVGSSPAIFSVSQPSDHVVVTIEKAKFDKAGKKVTSLTKVMTLETDIDEQGKGVLNTLKPLADGKYIARIYADRNGNHVYGKGTAFVVETKVDQDFSVTDLTVTEQDAHERTGDQLGEFVTFVLNTFQNVDTTKTFVAVNYVEYSRTGGKVYLVQGQINSLDKNNKIVYLAYKSVTFGSTILKDLSQGNKFKATLSSKLLPETHKLTAYVYDPKTATATSAKVVQFVKK